MASSSHRDLGHETAYVTEVDRARFTSSSRDLLLKDRETAHAKSMSSHATSSQDTRASTTRLYRTLTSIGLITVYHCPLDAKLILAQRFVRMFAFGLVALFLASYLAAIGLSETQIGVFFGATLVGDLVFVLILTQYAHRLGHKRILIVGSVLMMGSGIVFACVDDYWILLLAAIIGVISPNALDNGPFRTIEESSIFTVVTHNVLDIMSCYGTAEFLSLGIGMVLGSAMIEILQYHDWTYVEACKAVFGVYAGIGLLKVGMSCCLSDKIEPWTRQIDVLDDPSDAEHVSDRPEVSKHSDESQWKPVLGNEQDQPVKHAASTRTHSILSLNREERTVLAKLCILTIPDACAVGMTSIPWQTYFVQTRFTIHETQLGWLFFAVSTVGALGTILSTAMARRLGRMVTVAVTSYPTGILMLLFGAPKTLGPLLVVIVLVAFLEPFYIAPRHAMVGQLLTPDTRTASLGIYNFFKMSACAFGSFLTGSLADRELFWLAFVLAGCLKMVFASTMLHAFLAVDRRLAGEDEKRKAVDGQTYERVNYEDTGHD